MIKKLKIEVPEDWEIWNVMYEVNFDEVNKEDYNSLFCEDLLQISTPKGKIIDVGWYWDSDAVLKKGSFLGHIIKEATPESWNNPLERKEFKTWQEVKEWVSEWIEKLKEEKIETTADKN